MTWNAPNNAGDVFFYRNTGSAVSPQWQLITQNYLSLDQGERSQNHHADIDADNDFDLFSANKNDHISFYQNVGNSNSAQFRWITDSYQGIDVNGAHIFFSDIDADQDFDLFVGEVLIPNPPYPGLYLFQNRGTPQNASYSLYSSNLVSGNIPVGIIPALADIDGDGDDDLFITNNDSIRYFYENVGTASNPVFANPTQGWFGTFPPYQYFGVPAFCFYDIDNDGDLDLFGVPASAEHPYNWVWFYRNIGSAYNPVFLLETQELLVFERQEQFQGIDIFDIDNDGDGDILLSLFYDGGMYFFRNITGEPPGIMPKATAPYRGPVLTLGPNPANPSTWISFTLTSPQEATLAVYNILGAKVTTLTSGPQKPGEHTYYWNASLNASGVYIIRLETPKYTTAEKIMVVK